MAGLAVNDQFTITYRGTLSGQRVMTVLAAYVTVPSAATSVLDDLALLSDWAADTTAGSLLDAYLNCLADEVNIVDARAQRIYPSRSIYVSSAINETGTNTGTPPTPNIAAVLTKRSALEGRQGIGSIHLPGVIVEDMTSGLLSGGMLTKMTILGTELTGTKTIDGSTLEFKFCTARGFNAPSSPIFMCVPQDTVRVMRRRTVRVGE